MTDGARILVVIEHLRVQIVTDSGQAALDAVSRAGD